MSRFNGVQFLISAAAPAQFPPDVGAEVAFVGRSNAGKSSAINAITQRHALARTSKTPRAHAAAELFRARPDEAPGRPARLRLRERARSRAPAWLPLIDALRQRASLRGLFVIVDARRGLAAADAGVLEWALPHQRVHVLLSKADKLNRAEGAAVLQERRREPLGPGDGAAVLGAEGDRRGRGSGHARGLAQPSGWGIKKPRRSLEPPGSD